MSEKELRDVAKFVRGEEAVIHNSTAFLKKFEQLASELEALSDANKVVQAKYKEACKRNIRLEEELKTMQQERKEQIKKYMRGRDDDSEIIAANEAKISDDTKKLTKLATEVKKLKSEIQAKNDNITLIQEERDEKEKEIEEQDADKALKESEHQEKIKRLESEKLTAIKAKLDVEKQMTEQSQRIIELEGKNTELKIQLEHLKTQRAKELERSKAEGLMNKVNIKY